jgi:hypothetical protein
MVSLRPVCRTQEPLRTPQFEGRCPQESPKVCEVLWDGIGDGAFELSPHELVGVALRCVPREALHVQAGVGGLELPNRPGPVDRSAIPLQDQAAA